MAALVQLLALRIPLSTPPVTPLQQQVSATYLLKLSGVALVLGCFFLHFDKLRVNTHVMPQHVTVNDA